MRRPGIRTLALGVAALLAGAASSADARPEDPVAESELPSVSAKPASSTRSILDDPEWQKRFLGSYGFLSGAEPQVRAQELELLREVIDLMKVNPRAAATMLGAQVDGDSSAALDFILANLEFQNGNLEPALASYRAALEKFPDFRRAHKNLGLLLVQQGDCKGALPHLSQAVELGDRDGRNFGLMGYCYIEVENPLAAEQAYRAAVLQQPDTRDWKLGLARSLLAMEKNREAIALFGMLIDENPEDTSAWLLQANAYLGAEEPLAAAVNLEAVRMMGKAQDSSLILLGDIYMNEGMYDLAKGAYLSVVQADKASTRFETAYRAADLLIRSRSFDDAAEILTSMNERYRKKLSEPDELRLLTLEAKVARAQGRESEGAKLLESIVRRDGTRGDALLELAAYYQRKGNPQKALMLVERAEKLESFEYRALLDHAQFVLAERDYVKASELLRKALEIKHEPRVERFLARVEIAMRH